MAARLIAFLLCDDVEKDDGGTENWINPFTYIRLTTSRSRQKTYYLILRIAELPPPHTLRVEFTGPIVGVAPGQMLVADATMESGREISQLCKPVAMAFSGPGVLYLRAFANGIEIGAARYPILSPDAPRPD